MKRRTFLASSLCGLAALSLGQTIFSQEKKAAKKAADPVVSKEPLDSLFLTWQQDPTTTMTVQWVGADSAEDATIHYAPLDGAEWKTAKSIAKPFTNTEMMVRRC